MAAVSLRAGPIERELSLPDGRAATLRIGLLDSYIAPREQTTVALELWAEGEVVAALDTLLDPGDERGAHSLLDEAVRRLEAGELEPTAEALEPLADEAH
jgi:hypothetical protein